MGTFINRQNEVEYPNGGGDRVNQESISAARCRLLLTLHDPHPTRSHGFIRAGPFILVLASNLKAGWLTGWLVGWLVLGMTKGPGIQCAWKILMASVNML